MAEKAPATRPILTATANAKARLVEKHRNEFEVLLQQECETLGIEYKPKPTPEDIAQEKVEAILAKYPKLAAIYNSGLAEFRPAS